jgi:hypothetical protein
MSLSNGVRQDLKHVNIAVCMVRGTQLSGGYSELRTNPLAHVAHEAFRDMKQAMVRRFWKSLAVIMNAMSSCWLRLK